MTLDSLLVHDITILTPVFTEGRYHDAVKDWANATETDAKGWISQSVATEVLGDREAQVSDWVLYVLPDVAITAKDRVVWSGFTFEAAGPPNPAWSPRGLHHYEIPLKVVVG